jgi:hypothetical protein
MKKNLKIIFLSFILIGSFFSGSFFIPKVQAKSPDVFVGVDVAYQDMTQIKNLVDEISSYTNFFVIGCSAITRDKTKLEETCQYLYDKGLFFMVYQEWPTGYTFPFSSVSTWTDEAKTRWGEHFLGIYYLDESGGKQLDQKPLWTVIKNPKDYSDAANQFNNRISNSVNWFKGGYTDSENLHLFMSDYALYWFDYKAGYNGLFAQFGANYSRQLNIALIRGAAIVQNKEWGVMITWTYTEPPYIESGPELYKDMITAYDNGAKYIIIFDTNQDYIQSILQNEHLDALKQFWQYIQNNPRKSAPENERTAYVLPKDYAYGFRGPTDKIWGLWQADNFSYQQSVNINNSLAKYGSALDIIYDDGLTKENTQAYQQLIYWNTTSTTNSQPIPTITEPDPIGVRPLNQFNAAILIVTVFVVLATITLTARRKSQFRKL